MCRVAGSRVAERLATSYSSRMKELIQQLVSQAELSESQATRVAEVVRSFLAEKLPAPLKDPVESALTGQNVDNALDHAKGLVGKLF